MKNSNHNPPKWVFAFLQRICPEGLLEEIEGDLLEKFEKDLKNYGPAHAKRRMAWNAVRYFRPGILFRDRFSFKISSMIMYQNYFKVFIRNTSKHKGNTAINISGLIVGLTFSMLTGVFIWQELGVNKQLQDVERLYILERGTKDGSSYDLFTPSALGKVAAEKYPNIVEDYFRFWDRNIKITNKDKHLIVQGMIGDPGFLKMFGWRILHGDATTALKEPYSIVVTESMALRFFSRTDVVGETLGLTNGTSEKKEFIITAIVEDFGRNSITDLVNIDAQFIVPFLNANDFLLPDPNEWRRGLEIITYLKLSPNTSSDKAKNVLAKLIETHGVEEQKENPTPELVPISDYYLISQQGAAGKLIMALIGITFFILLAAAINFINISIASAAVRLKEIGVRKVIGGLRRQIIFQFLLESMIITFLAGGASIVLYELLRPVFGDFLDITLSPLSILDFAFWGWFTGLVLCIGLLAGAWPAFFMSSYRAVESLKGKLKEARGNFGFSKVLMTTQLLVGIFVLIFSIIVARQVSYFLDKDLGYDKSFVLTVSSLPRIWSEEGIRQMETARQEFLGSPHVETASLSWEVPNGNNGGDIEIYKSGEPEEEAIRTPLLRVDENYADVYRLKLVEGVFFHQAGEERQPGSIVINKAAAQSLDVKVGDRVKIKGNDFELPVKGIVADFNFYTLHKEVKPIIMLHVKDGNRFRFLSFRVSPGNVNAAIADIGSRWKQIFPDDPFDFEFMDDHLAKLYKKEQQLKQASSLAAMIMLVVISIGVLGLAALGVSKRTKEIGIRKVLGASVGSVLLLFSKEYFRMGILAFLVAVPLSFWLTNLWLEGFAYRISVQWWMFALPGICLTAIVVILVAALSQKAARANPVKSLKTE